MEDCGQAADQDVADIVSVQVPANEGGVRLPALFRVVPKADGDQAAVVLFGIVVLATHDLLEHRLVHLRGAIHLPILACPPSPAGVRYPRSTGGSNTMIDRHGFLGTT